MPCLADGAGLARWRVEGVATPQLPLRILGLLAQRDRLFTGCDAMTRGETLSMTIAIDRVTHHDAELIAEKMRMIVGVTAVALDWTPDRDA